MLNHIRFILVETSHPGNIGAAARAMKNMGFNRMCLVNPKQFPHPKADEMASNAGDVLKAATIYSSFEEAIKDCHLVIGTSARDRAIPWPLLDPRQTAIKISEFARPSNVAIVFGREQSGLTNEELHLCHYHLHIPSNPEYNSLNLAQAIQVIAYELRMTLLYQDETNKNTWDNEFATAHEVHLFYEHLEKVLTHIDFLKESAPRQLMARLKRLFNRAHLDKMEVNILRGMLTAIEKQLG